MARRGLPAIELPNGFALDERSRKLGALTGDRRAWSHVVELRLWCAENQPDGRIEAGDADQSRAMAEFAAGWTGTPGKFIAAALETGYLRRATNGVGIVVVGMSEASKKAERERVREREKKRTHRQRIRDRLSTLPLPMSLGESTRGVHRGQGPMSTGDNAACPVGSPPGTTAAVPGDSTGGQPSLPPPGFPFSPTPPYPLPIPPPSHQLASKRETPAASGSSARSWPRLGRDGLAEGDLPVRKLEVIDTTNDPDPYPHVRQLATGLRNRVGPLTAPLMPVIGKRRTQDDPEAVERESTRLETAIVRAGDEAALEACAAATFALFKAGQSRPEVLSWYTERIEKLPPAASSSQPSADDQAIQAAIAASSTCPEWEKLFRRIAGQLRSDLVARWFAGLRPMPRTNGTLHLVAPDRFHADFIRDNYAEFLAGLPAEVLGEQVRIEVTACS